MDHETYRLIDLLKVNLRMLGISNREVARRLGMSPSYISKLFSGTSELRLDHLVRTCQVTGIELAEFFTLAYPQGPEPSTTAMVRLRNELQRDFPKSPPAFPQQEKTYTEAQVQEMLRLILVKLLEGSDSLA
jgi:transcriptional regulator with XRE-family HTH domain